MNDQAIIGLSVLLCFIAFGIVTANYITPHLQAWSREDAIKALAAPHMFRFVGLAFLMPGVVSPTLSPAFANPAAYGDLTAAILAMIAVLGLSVRASWAMLAVWIFNIEGTADLLFAYYQGIVGAPQPPWRSWRGLLHSDADRAAAIGDACADLPAITSGQGAPTLRKAICSTSSAWSSRRP